MQNSKPSKLVSPKQAARLKALPKASREKIVSAASKLLAKGIQKLQQPTATIPTRQSAPRSPISRTSLISRRILEEALEQNHVLNVGEFCERFAERMIQYARAA